MSSNNTAHLSIGVHGQQIRYEEATSSYDLGKQTRTADPEKVLFGVIQPASQASVQNIPEGQRADITFTLHTKTELKIAADGAGGGGVDTFIIRGNDRYKAVNIGLWNDAGFYKYGLIKTKVGM